MKDSSILTNEKLEKLLNDGEGFTIAAYCMIALLAISLIVGLIGMPDRRGKSLEQITKERYGDNY